MIFVKVVIHFDTEDEEFQGDYQDIELFVNGVCFRTFADYYHEKGMDYIDGFIDGLSFFDETVDRTDIRVADRSY